MACETGQTIDIFENLKSRESSMDDAIKTRQKVLESSDSESENVSVNRTVDEKRYKFNYILLI